MYFEKNSHYGKQTFWEKRYAEYMLNIIIEILVNLIGTKIGLIYEISSRSL